MVADITVIDGVRYRTEDARARGLVAESAAQGGSDEEFETRLAHAIAEAKVELEADFDARVAAEADRRASAVTAGAEPVAAKPAEKSAKPVSK